MRTSLAIPLAVIAFAAFVLAVIQIGITCCPITIKHTPNKATAASTADTHFGQKQAVVPFDDTQTSVLVSVKATTGTGYPSSIKK